MPNSVQISRLAMAALTIGLACLFSTLLIYSGTVISFLRFEQTELFVGTFAEITLLTASLSGALLVGLALAGKRVPFMLLSAVGGVCYLCCSLSFIFFSWFGSFGQPFTVALAVATAIADSCLALAWGRICSRFKMKQALVVVSLASVVSAGICFLYATLPLPAVAALFVLASIVAVIIPLAFADRAGTPVTTAPVAENWHRQTRTTLTSLANVVLAPGLGLLVFAFALAIMRTTFNESQDTYLAALALASGGLLAYAVLRKKRFSLHGGLHQTFLPLMATVLLAVTSITASAGQGSEAATFLTYLLYSLAAVLTLATLCAITNAGEFPSDLVFGMAILLFSAASFAGQNVASVLDDSTINIAVTVTTTLYAFALVLLPYIQRQREFLWADDATAAQQGEQLPSNTPSSPADRCAQLAAAYKLTAREQEILGYLAEGHSGAYIADALFISPNTARTHIHNIYRKLDVSSREDVLRLTKG